MILATALTVDCREGTVAAGKPVAVIQARDDGILSQDGGTDGGQMGQILDLR